MASWRDVAAQVLASDAADAAQPRPAEAALILQGLPADLAAYLLRLERLPPPRRINNRDWWAATVVDALRLAREGWAGKALRLGWSPIELYGIDPIDSYDFAGLAVWLRGGELVLLDADSAIAKAAANQTRHLKRGGFGHGADAPRPPVMLWEFGR